MLFEIERGESAIRATGARGRCGRFWLKRGFDQLIRERKPAGICDPLGLGASLAQIDLIHLIVHYLCQVYRGGFAADFAL